MEDKKRLWQNFFNNPSDENKEQLILAYAPLIKYCAQRIYQGLPDGVEFDELIQYGSLGLIDAVHKFDSKLSNNFEGYAVIRIRGAIIDGLRKMDWAPQSLRRKTKEIEKVYFSMEQELGRTPLDEEVAQVMGITTKQLLKDLQAMQNLSIVSLEQPIDNGGTDFFSIGDFLVDSQSPNPMENIEKIELQKHLEQALTELKENERLVITLFYYEELTIKEISKILDLTEGRISQIHKKAIGKLKEKLQQLIF
ncbi:MAG: FliA/WhiG family RNA polymerase sigma factor [Peptococcales bacterium]|jgi:RNA polymerase sigma factor for flagellar operon FliA